MQFHPQALVKLMGRWRIWRGGFAALKSSLRAEYGRLGRARDLPGKDT
jgi:hypothetical protein